MQRIAEIRVQGKPLGRHVHHDPRSREYAAEQLSVIGSVQHASQGLPLDQGQIGSCTANALIGALNTAPGFGGTVYTEADAVKLYERETADEGKPYPQYDPGGSGLAVCKAAKELGLITSYRHTFSLESALRALMLRPVIAGMNWYSSFDEPAPDGLVAIAGDAFVRGGHEVMADAIDADNGLVWFCNSWGKSWGRAGRFCMSFSTLGRLLDERGDVTVPVVAQ